MPESLFNEVAGLRPAILLKRRLWQRCFPVNFANFLRIPFLTEHLRWLLLKLLISFLNSIKTDEIPYFMTMHLFIFLQYLYFSLSLATVIY